MVKRIIGVLTAIVFLITFTFCEDIAFAGQATDEKTTAIVADEEPAGLLEESETEEFVYTEENGSLTLTRYAGSEKTS